MILRECPIAVAMPSMVLGVQVWGSAPCRRTSRLLELAEPFCAGAIIFVFVAVVMMSSPFHGPWLPTLLHDVGNHHDLDDDDLLEATSVGWKHGPARRLFGAGVWCRSRLSPGRAGTCSISDETAPPLHGGEAGDTSPRSCSPVRQLWRGPHSPCQGMLRSDVLQPDVGYPFVYAYLSETFDSSWRKCIPFGDLARALTTWSVQSNDMARGAASAVEEGHCLLDTAPGRTTKLAGVAGLILFHLASFVF